MALVKCPECEKSISDRAHSCPFCGFPMDEYIKEIEEEKIRSEERRKEEEKKQSELERQKKYSAKQKFSLFGRQIYIDENERICSVVGFVFQCVQEKLHDELQKVLLSSDTPSNYNKNNFAEYANRLLTMFRDEIMNRACFISERFIDKNSEDYEYFENDILESVDLSLYFRLLCDMHSKFYSNYDLNVDNAHMQYYDDYYAAGTPAKPIDEIYSDTLLGMIGPGIAARLINGAVGVITNGTIKPKERVASDKFYNTVMAEKIKLDALVLSVADDFIDEIVGLYKESVLNYLLDANIIFEVSIFPKNGYDYKNIVEYLSDETYANDSKKMIVVDSFENNPADFSVYAMVLATMSYTVEDVIEIKRIISYFDIQEQVRELLRDFNTSAIRLLETEVVTVDDVKVATMASKTLNKRQFSSVEKKELYIKEEKLFMSNVKNFLEDTRWYDKGNLSAKCKQLQNMNRPTFKEWQEDYDCALKLANYLNDKVVVEPMSKIAPSISGLRKAENIVHCFPIKDFRNSDWKENDLLEGCCESLEEDELPIIIIQYYAEKLIITTRYFYYCQKSKLIKRFGLDEIEEVYIHKKTAIDPASICIRVIDDDCTYRMFANNIPDNIYKALLPFADKLKRYSDENTSIKEKHLSTILKSTSDVELTEEWLVRQLDSVARIKYLINSMPCRKSEYKRMQWTYETDSDLMTIVTKNKIGHEYILYYDRHYIVTEQAVYIEHKYDDSKTNFRRYAFEKYDEIIPVVLACDYYTEYRLLLVEKNPETQNLSSLLIKPLSMNEFKNAIFAINIVRLKEKIGSNISLCSRDFMFCSKCSKIYEVYDKKMKKCVNCKAKLRDDGWKNMWVHDEYYELSCSLKEDRLNEIREFISVDKDIIFKLVKKEDMKRKQ